MKKTFFGFLLLLLLCAGCVTRYSMVLTNGDIVTTHGKPHLDKVRNRYVYTDATGQQSEIPATRVREIAPASMADKGNSRFLPSTR